MFNFFADERLIGLIDLLIFEESTKAVVFVFCRLLVRQSFFAMPAEREHGAAAHTAVSLVRCSAVVQAGVGWGFRQMRACVYAVALFLFSLLLLLLFFGVRYYLYCICRLTPFGEVTLSLPVGGGGGVFRCSS